VNNERLLVINIFFWSSSIIHSFTVYLFSILSMKQDCIEKFSKEYIKWYKTIPQQIEKAKREMEFEREVNQGIKLTNSKIEKRKKQIMFDLKYKKKVGTIE